VVKTQVRGICARTCTFTLKASPPGIVLGHENVGTVAEVAQGRGVEVGDRVIAGPPDPAGKCYYCLHGKPSSASMVSSRRTDCAVMGNGRVYAGQGSQVYAHQNSRSVPFEDAVLMDCLATATTDYAVCFRMGDNVVVSGAASIGLSVISSSE